MTTDEIREIAVAVLVDVERGSFLDRALQMHREDLRRGDPGESRLHFLTTGTVKWNGRLDRELEQRLPHGINSLPAVCRAILRLALFELRHGKSPDYAVVDTAVGITRKHGLHGLVPVVNGVLRNAVREGEPPLPEDAAERLAVEQSHPAWLLAMIDDVYGFGAAAGFAAWNNMPPPLWVRVNRAVMAMEKAAELLLADDVDIRPGTLLTDYLLLGEGTVPARLNGIKQGWLTVQDPSAGLASYAAMPVDGSLTADICAAPGGKATHLAELGATVEASDSAPERMIRLRESIQRHAGGNIQAVEYKDLLIRRGEFDLVLVDVPCSNTGVLRRRADARWRLEADGHARLAQVQYELLENGGELVRPGGVLVYSTCTLLPVENELVVDRFLSHHTAFIPDPLPDTVPELFRTGEGRAISLPWMHGLDGSFVARMKRLQ
ncbi:RsmB/NOP family class I SAM-dependent RNA methyltransferase [Gemmatimonadota bacterium]